VSPTRTSTRSSPPGGSVRGGRPWGGRFERTPAHQGGLAANINTPVAGDDAAAVLKLIDALDDDDDVQNVYSNVEISDEDMERLSASQRSPRARSRPEA
jgi:hypothetical protein